MEGKLKEVKVLEEKLKKLKDNYILMISQRDKTKATTKKIPKHLRIKEVMYVFIVFRDSCSSD